MKDKMRTVRISHPVCSDCSVSDDFIYGVEPLTQQLRTARFGGTPVADTRPQNDSFYDEDDVYDVDPSADPSLDRFERAEAVASQISDRMAAAHRDKLEHAKS